MSKEKQIRFMILDACVLMDYINGEPDLFKLISTHIGALYVATPILEEVDSIDSIDELEELGLLSIEPEIEDVFRVVEMVKHHFKIIFAILQLKDKR